MNQKKGNHTLNVNWFIPNNSANWMNNTRDHLSGQTSSSAQFQGFHQLHSAAWLQQSPQNDDSISQPTRNYLYSSAFHDVPQNAVDNIIIWRFMIPLPSWVRRGWEHFVHMYNKDEWMACREGKASGMFLVCEVRNNPATASSPTVLRIFFNFSINLFCSCLSVYLMVPLLFFVFVFVLWFSYAIQHRLIHFILFKLLYFIIIIIIFIQITYIIICLYMVCFMLYVSVICFCINVVQKE